MATVHDIARICNVSETTVTRAFHQDSRISDEVRAKILKTAKDLGYVPKKYKTKSSIRQTRKTIGLLIDCCSFPSAERIISGIDSVLDNEDVNLIISHTGDYAESEITKLNYLKDIVDGLIIVPAHNQSEYIKTFIKEISKSIPVVILSRNIGVTSAINVCLDFYPRNYEATQLLIDNGHKNIAFASGPLGIQQSFAKLTAYQKALEDNNIQIKSEYIVYNNIGEDHIVKNIEKLLTMYPEITAILTGNVGITQGCLIALEKLGYEVGKNIALISNGTAFPFSIKPYKLTAIYNPQYEMGARGATEMIKLLDNYKYEKKRHMDDITMVPGFILNGSEKYPTEPIITTLGKRKTLDDRTSV